MSKKNIQIEEILPNAALSLMSKNTCIAWPCTTCGGAELEKEILLHLNNFLINSDNFKQAYEMDANKILKELFIKALCKIDMNLMLKAKKEVETTTAPFSGSFLPLWAVFLRNISKNDISYKSTSKNRLSFHFNYEKVYTYWIINRIDEMALIDFMVFYDKFVPELLKSTLMNKAEEMLKKTNSRSLRETLNYRK